MPVTDQQIIDLTHEVATVGAGLKSHLDECGRRYLESSQRQERVFEYLKQIHQETSTKIDDLNQSIVNQKILNAEQLGGRKMAKAIWGGVIVVAGGIGGAIVEFFRGH